jgi:hypothetical protein
VDCSGVGLLFENRHEWSSRRRHRIGALRPPPEDLRHRVEGRSEAARFTQIRSVVWLALPQDDQKQTSNGGALRAAGDDPACREQ